MRNQQGQTVLILILVMTVALGIGLSVIQRSLSDISTSTRIEQSSRAYSAAEAGIEKVIQSGSNISSPISLGNNSSITDAQSNLIPVSRQALEYLPVAKEELAQVWLADPDTLAQYYNQTSLDVYWGVANTVSDKPALSVTVIYYDGTSYQSKKFFYDSVNTRTDYNKFTKAEGDCTNPPAITTSLGTNRQFLCKTTVTGLPNGAGTKLILLRARILYSSASQPFAVQPLGDNCGVPACSLPPQARLFTATGISGETQRKIQVFQLDRVVPQYFDYAIFSADEITK